MSDQGRAAALRRRLDKGADGRRRLLTAPGCHDALSALLIEQAGFEVAFLSGAALSFARLGRPDIGLTNLSDVTDAVFAIRDRVDLALLVDADTGFGNAETIGHTVRALERAGATAIQIEDQVFPKRCGHMAGKAVIPADEALDKLKAALDARRDMLIIGRTDAVAVEGIDSALERAARFAEVGCDLVFVEGPRDEDETRRVVELLADRVPLVHNLVEGGVSAVRDADGLEALGFAVAIHPITLLLGFTRLAPRLLSTLRAARDTRALAEDLGVLADINALVR